MIDIAAYRAHLVTILETIEYQPGEPLPVAAYPWANPQPPLAVIYTGADFIDPRPDFGGGDWMFQWRVGLYVDNNNADLAHADLDALLPRVLETLMAAGYGLENVTGYEPVAGFPLLACVLTINDPNDIN